jgi:hypothetical protein
MGGFVQSTSPWRVRLRDTWLHTIDGTIVQRLLAENLKPLPTYGGGVFAVRPARVPARRTVGSLFPQTGRLDDRLGSSWAAVTIDEAARAFFIAAGLPAVDPGADGDWLRRRGLTWALLRPDRFVYACGAPGDRLGLPPWWTAAPAPRLTVAA